MTLLKGTKEVDETAITELTNYPNVSANYLETRDGPGVEVIYSGPDNTNLRLVESKGKFWGQDLDKATNPIYLEINKENPETLLKIVKDLPNNTITIDGKKYRIENPREFVKNAYEQFNRQPLINEDGTIVE